MTTQYSSHDYRKNTDDAVVVDEHNNIWNHKRSVK